MQSEMKPCPFCGCEKILNGYIRDGREIVCGECRASVVAFHPDASKRAAERWNRRAEAALSAAEPVKTPFEVASQHIREARVSLLSRAIRQGLNDYGWKNFGTLPEVLMGYIVEAERADEAAHPKKSRDCGHYGGDLSERRDNIGSTYTRSALSAQVQDVAGWQDISTLEPKDGMIVMGWGEYRERDGFSPAFMRWYDSVGGWNVNAMPFYPTHWMPLPAAPAKQEG